MITCMYVWISTWLVHSSGAWGFVYTRILHGGQECIFLSHYVYVYMYIYIYIYIYMKALRDSAIVLVLSWIPSARHWERRGVSKWRSRLGAVLGGFEAVLGRSWRAWSGQRVSLAGLVAGRGRSLKWTPFGGYWLTSSGGPYEGILNDFGLP